MTIAVIIPVLNECRCIGGTLTRTGALGFDEIVVVDGGSTDETVSIVETLAKESPEVLVPRSASPIRLIQAPRGRARQCNAGAATSRCDAYLFLHADTQLPSHARQALDRTLADQTYVGGRFDVRFDADRVSARMVSCLMNLRSRRTGIATGDQALFVRRDIFEQLGGFADIPLMEDIDFTRRLKRIAASPPCATRSSRPFDDGNRKAPGVQFY